VGKVMNLNTKDHSPVSNVDSGVLNRLIDSSGQNIQIIEKLTIFRWFDEETINFLCASDNGQIIEQVLNLSFVETRNYGYGFHDIVREKINADILSKSPEYYRELHKEATRYYQYRLNRSSRLFAQKFLIELAYHKLRADEKNGIVELNTMLDRAKSFGQNEYCCALIETTFGWQFSHENKTKVKKIMAKYGAIRYMYSY
jgi:hypothetical protein